MPVLQPKDPTNRYPDLVILREEHPELTQRRLTITRDSPPPRLIVEILDPRQTNRNRDLQHKRSQYAAIGVLEYWLIDPQNQSITVLKLQANRYQTVGIFQNSDRILSPELGELNLTVNQILQAQ